ncbi:Gfo/Idh/MocA family protein [Neobacillus dielmonensis]|uniref:Gfo/Idh/MocA family protein n=1 Tax=Neobacillus dielmonensis TaxID=1347369 RepID=UPI0005AA38A9|nr:Gfo/Idh/MocA family oxidoreductase [Neobacillus dielmonensis]
MKKLKWGIVGTGKIVNKMGPAIQMNHLNEWVGVAGRNKQNSLLAANRYGVKKAYEHYDELIRDPEVDVVYIALLNHLHKEWAIKAIEAGKHVLIEKPLGLSEGECQEVKAVLGNKPLKVMEAFAWRFHPAHLRVKEIIDSGEIGEPVLFNGHFSFIPESNSTRFNPDWGGGSLYDVGCYPISWARFFMNGEPTEADGKLIVNKANGVDLRFVGLLHFANGRFAQVSSSFDMPHGSFYEILGTKGKIATNFRITANSFAIDVLKNKKLIQSFESDRVMPYRYQVNYFTDCLINHQPLDFPIDDAINNLRVMDALKLSSATGKRIKLH